MTDQTIILPKPNLVNQYIYQARFLSMDVCSIICMGDPQTAASLQNPIPS